MWKWPTYLRINTYILKDTSIVSPELEHCIALELNDLANHTVSPHCIPCGPGGWVVTDVLMTLATLTLTRPPLSLARPRPALDWTLNLRYKWELNPYNAFREVVCKHSINTQKYCYTPTILNTQFIHHTGLIRTNEGSSSAIINIHLLQQNSFVLSDGCDANMSIF